MTHVCRAWEVQISEICSTLWQKEARRGTPHGLRNEATQVPAPHAQQRHQIGRGIPLPVLCPAAHLLQQGAQALLHLHVPRRTALEAGQQ